jgi:hypothetical protein
MFRRVVSQFRFSDTYRPGVRPRRLVAPLVGLVWSLTLILLVPSPAGAMVTTSRSTSGDVYDRATQVRSDAHSNRLPICSARSTSPLVTHPDDERGTVPSFERRRFATNSADELVDLASPARRTHILDGDATGGGHRWPGAPDKTPFPQGWSDDEIMHAVSDVATDPTLTPRNLTGPAGSLKTNAGNPARQEVFGMRNGVCIRVVTEPLGKGIITAHPIIGPC